MSKMQNDDPRDQAKAALQSAQRASKRGDIKEAERWSKVAQAMSDAAAKLAALPSPQDSLEEEQRIREELRDRHLRFIDEDIAWREWQFEAQVHRAYAERAKREGLPPPPPLRAAPDNPGNIWKHMCDDRPEHERSIAAMFARAIERQTLDYCRLKVAAEKP